MRKEARAHSRVHCLGENSNSCKVVTLNLRGLRSFSILSSPYLAVQILDGLLRRSSAVRLSPWTGLAPSLGAC